MLRYVRTRILKALLNHPSVTDGKNPADATTHDWLMTIWGCVFSESLRGNGTNVMQDNSHLLNFAHRLQACALPSFEFASARDFSSAIDSRGSYKMPSQCLCKWNADAIQECSTCKSSESLHSCLFLDGFGLRVASSVSFELLQSTGKHRETAKTLHHLTDLNR